ncbi:MAG: hypothetical protein GY772_23065 [bacterium]|nr:hypothetical protein [bacterium]
MEHVEQAEPVERVEQAEPVERVEQAEPVDRVEWWVRRKSSSEGRAGLALP